MIVKNHESSPPEQSGYTIVELLISVAVGAIASVLMVTAFVYIYGGVVVEQARSSMVLESQLFLGKIVDDVRVANEIRTTNQISDTYEPGGGWITSDPANIMIITQPATDATDDFIYDSATGFPYQNEIVYFGDEDTMYRR